MERLAEQVAPPKVGVGVTRLVPATASGIQPRPRFPQRFVLGATLRDDQAAAVADLTDHDHGVLVAPPGAGKQLLEVERGWRDMKQILDLRPVYHRLEQRIRAHVLLCWLALLLIRIIETSTGQTWHHLRRDS